MLARVETAVVMVVVVVMIMVLVVVVVVLVERGNLPAALYSSLELCPLGSPCSAAESPPSFYLQTPSSPEYSTVQYSTLLSTIKAYNWCSTLQYSIVH